jgi:glucose-6-phosphate isomerase
MKLGYGRMFADRLDGKHGLSRAALDELVSRFPVMQDELRSRRQLGEYGFMSLGEQAGTVGEIRRFADGVGQAFDHVLVLGIGGSALGTRALLSALKPAAWNELSDEAREYFPRLTVLENVDPSTVSGALARIDPRRVLVNVVSKSGATAETLAQYLIVRQWLETAVGPEAASHHMVFTTDPERGALRQIAARENIPALEVPPPVGGRFSVLSPVGLLPAALVGIDIEALLKGARRAVRQAESSRLLENPAALLSGLLWAADARQGARLHVLMPYSDRLREFAEWYRQLWAESLGKRLNRLGEEVWTGPDPGERGRRHRSAQPGAALHGGSLRQGVTFIPGRGPRGGRFRSHDEAAFRKTSRTSQADRWASLLGHEQDATAAAWRARDA